MAVNEYEESRRRMLEENKKRMAELGLVDLAESFNSQTSKTMKRKAPSSPAEVLASRRSARTAGKPKVDYKLTIAMDRYIGCSPADIAIIEAVEEALAELINPAFVRHVLYTYGAGSYHAYIPLEFRRTYLPETDKWFTLEDEDGMEWSTLYDSKAGDVRSGWRDFSLHHALEAGDCCIFELVNPSRFRVQIFRFDEYDRGRSGRKRESNGKKVAGKGRQKEKISCSRKCTVPEDDGHGTIDREPKLEARTLEQYRSAERQAAAGLSFPIDTKPKLEAKPIEDNQGLGRREASPWKPIDKMPKPEPLEDYRIADPGQFQLPP